MWKLGIRSVKVGVPKLVFVFDDDAALRWSGPTLLGAMRYLAEWGRERVEIDVDSMIFYLGPEDAT